VLFFVIAILFNANAAYSQDEFVPGQLVVKLKDRTKLNALVSEVSKDNSEIVDSIEELDLYVVEVPTDQLENKRVQFSRNNSFQYVDKNYIVKANAIPNDSLFGQQSYFNLIDAQSRLGIL